MGCYPLEGPISFRLMHGERHFLNRLENHRHRFLQGHGRRLHGINGDGIPISTSAT